MMRLVHAQLESDQRRVDRLTRAALKDAELRGLNQQEIREHIVDVVMGRVDGDDDAAAD